jgi:hypothetical protein
MKVLGVHVGFNPQVFLKLLKVANHHLFGADPDIKMLAVKLSGDYFLPGLCIIQDSNQYL